LRRCCRRTFGAAGLRVARDFAITPFVRVFVFERDH
jgi:hypothetical protein